MISGKILVGKNVVTQRIIMVRIYKQKDVTNILMARLIIHYLIVKVIG